MNDELKSRWAVFMKYRFPGYKVREKSDEISFEQTYRSSELLMQSLWVWIIITFSPLVYCLVVTGFSLGGLFSGMFLMIPSVLVGSLVFAILYVVRGKRTAYIKVRRGEVALHREKLTTTVKLSDIAGISLNQQGGLVVSDRGMPLSTVYAGGGEASQALLMGVETAVLMLNPDYAPAL